MQKFGQQLPDIRAEVPGALSQQWVQRLAEVECPAITHRRHQRDKNGVKSPIVWAKAQGANIQDVEGNIYVDLSGAFAVASVGHAHPKVVEAAQKQVATLIHAMGDLFPSTPKVLLSERLVDIAPKGLTRVILGIGGSDGVEAALKTALIATGKRRVLSFGGGYHGMSFGALNVSSYRDSFRDPFDGLVGATELRLPYPGQPGSPFGDDAQRCLDYLDFLLGSDTHGSSSIAGVIVEPIQGRGGVIVPPTGFLSGLRELTRRHGILLILDEIYTGFGRTGTLFACEQEDVVPDLMAVGKSLAGGAPIGACLGTEEAMNGWGRPDGEAIHTSTFLGNPLVAAMALAVLDVMEDEQLVKRSRTEGAYALSLLQRELAKVPIVKDVRGRGMMIGIELQHTNGTTWQGGGLRAMSDLLHDGIVVAPGGTQGEVISLAPPLNIERKLLDAGIEAIVSWAHRVASEA